MRKYGLILCLTIRFLAAQEPDATAGSGRQSAAALLLELQQRFEQKQYRAAVQAADTYLLLYPRHYRVLEANFYRSVGSYQLGRMQEARSGLSALLAADPEEARRLGAFYWLGLASYRLGEIDTAYDIWLRQLAISEATAADYRQHSYLGLAQIMNERGDPAAALNYYRLLEGRNRRRAGFAHGTLALREGLYHEAYNAFSAYLIQQQVGAGPSRVQALFYQGQAAFLAGLLAPARQSLDTVLRLYDSRERLFLAALIMRLRLALEEGDNDTAQRFYDEALLLEQRQRHGLTDWLNAVELPLFIQQGHYPLALKHMRAKLARSRSPSEREIARFNVALVWAFLDIRYATRQLQKLKESFIPGIRERSHFHSARLQVSFPLTRQEGLAEMEEYLAQYPQGVYAQEAQQILLTIYRSDPERFWLPASALLEKLTEFPDAWPQLERARFYLYWAEMARQLKNTTTALQYLHQSWKLAPRQLVGLQAYYRSGAIYFAQKQYNRALGYFREVQLQLAGLPLASSPAIRAQAAELGFYAELAIAQTYAGAGRPNESLWRFQELIRKSRKSGQNVQQVQLQLGLVYFYQQAYEQAVTTFDAIISQGTFPANQPDQYPPVLLALYWKGEALFRQGLFAAARQSFRRASEIYPEALGATAYLRAALAAQAAGDYASVVADLQRAQALVPNFLGAGPPWQILNIDFHLVKYNLLLERDAAAIAAAKHMLKIAPSAYHFLGEAFLEVAELHFNRGELGRSLAILSLLERQFIRKLPPRRRNSREERELYLEEGPPYMAGLDNTLLASIQDGLFSFDAREFLRRYRRAPAIVADGSNAAVLDNNINFYLQNLKSEEKIGIIPSIFSALYLLGMVHTQQEDFLAASRYFLEYLKKDPLGPYAISAVGSLLRLLPELNTRQFYARLKRARLGDALSSVLLVRYWSLQEDKRAKKLALEKIIQQTLSLNARREAMYHLSVYYRRQGNSERARQLLLELRNIKGGNLALDPENYWAGLANLELGRAAYRAGRMGEAKIFFQAIATQAQVERETLAEAFYWLASMAHFEGKDLEARHYRQNLQNLAPESEWLRKLN